MSLRPTDERPPFPPVEDLCRIAHDAYEAAAVEHGWQTQEASRVPWDNVPAANQATMRAAMGAVWTHVTGTSIAPLRAERDEARAEVARLTAAVERVEALADDLDLTGIPASALMLNGIDERDVMRPSYRLPSRRPPTARPRRCGVYRQAEGLTK